MSKPQAHSHTPAHGPFPAGERGIAIMIVMLLFSVLVPFIVEFAYQVSLESRISFNVADELKLDNAIDGQREIVLARIEYDAPNNEFDSYDDGWNDGDIRERSDSQKDGTQIQLKTLVFDAQAKFNLNNLATGSEERRQLWKTRFAALIRSFREDTKYDASGDADELAEDLYRYMNGEASRADIPFPNLLDENRKMLTVEELYFVNDKFASERMLEDIRVSEDEIAPGLHRYVTVHGNGKINLNTAQRRLLRAMFPEDKVVADRIIERRGGGALEDEDEDDEEDTTSSDDEDGEGGGEPFTDVNQVSELDDVNLALLRSNKVDLNEDFDVKTNVFEMRITASTERTRRDELFIVERIPASNPEEPLDGFQFLLTQERSDILEYGVDDTEIDDPQ